MKIIHRTFCSIIMKIFTFLIVACILQAYDFIYAQSNLKKSAYNFGGGISFSFSDTDDLDDESTTQDILISPSATYFFSDNISAGLGLQLEYRENATRNIKRDSVLSKSVNKILNVGPTARYYFHTHNFAPFVELSLGYTTFLKADNHGIAASLGTGINYFITQNVAFEPHVIYTLSKFFSPSYRINRYTFGIRIFYQISD